MKKILLFVMACLIISSAWAKRESRFNPGFDDEKPWQELAEPLPEFPEINQADWLNFTVNNTFKGQAMILFPSIYQAKDGSIRYVYNLRSEGGFDNLSVEAINCQENTYKIFAFGDTVHHRWIESRSGQWASMGSALYSVDAARHILRQTLCSGKLPENINQLKKSLEKNY